VYLCTQNGNHRLAAARLVGLKEVMAQVEGFKDKSTDRWFDLLAAMPPNERTEWKRVYDSLRPPSEEESVRDDEQLMQAQIRHPDLLEAATRRWQKREKEAVFSDKEFNKRVDDAKRRYVEVKTKQALYERHPRFQQELNRAAVDYYSTHKYSFARERFFLEPDEKGWMPSRPDRGIGSHILGIDLDAYPLQTDKEILWRAIQAFEKAHPELTNPFEK
jgi:hypothetical protein